MKKIPILFFAAGSLFMASCEKEVIDKVVPREQLTADLAFSTPEKIESSTMAMYDGLQNLNYLGGRAMIYIDLLGNDVVDKNQFFGNLPRYQLLSNDGFSAGIWNAAYNSIARANRAIAGITANADKLTPTKAQQLIAECKFVRAVNHFYLVNFFGQPYGFTPTASHLGVPIITENFTSNDPAANKPRATVKEVYDAIIKDLTEALPNIPTTYANTYQTRTRGTKAATAAFLARVYLYMGDYTNARTQANAVISNTYGSYALRPNPRGAFGPGNYTTNETVWSIPHNVNDNPNTNNALPQHYFEAGRGDLVVSPTFLNASTNPWLGADDLRRTAMIDRGVTPQNTNFFFTNKYPDVQSRSDWAPVIRLAEVYLTFAEASARIASGVDADAITRLNQVRDRAKGSAPSYTAADFANKDALINAILGERRVELAFEGHRGWDMARVRANITNKLDADLTLLPTLNYGADKFILPIPQIEVDKSNGVLVQNPGY
ncbi:MAG TPA: RagB/SusD family nutrient uptake outer membrane protein [Phnomibacter sp.]|nr:RagB/SusD family nutrient uptake outer membrane protein [Phnomibacter sp.]